MKGSVSPILSTKNSATPSFGGHRTLLYQILLETLHEAKII